MKQIKKIKAVTGHFLPVIKNPDFLKLWISQILSQLTINIMNFVLITKIFEKTGSSIAVSLLWISYALPAIFFLPLAGPLIDVSNRKLVLFFTNLLQAATIMLFLPFINHFYSIFPIVFLYSTLNQFYLPAEAASIPDLVPKKHLSAANSLFLVTSQVMFILGFGAGGPILSLLGQFLPFVIGALLLLTAASVVIFLPDSTIRENNFAKSMLNFYSEFNVGFRYIKDRPVVLYPLVIMVIGNLLFSVLAAVFPSISQDILGSSIRHAGPTLIVPVGIGALIASYSIPKLLNKKRKYQIIELGMLLLAIGLALFSMLIPILPIKLYSFDYFRFIFAIPTIILIGFASIIIFIPSQTMVQERTPDILRGRILSVVSFFMTVSSIIPLLFGAAIADLLGVRTTLLLIAAAIISALYLSRNYSKQYTVRE